MKLCLVLIFSFVFAVNSSDFLNRSCAAVGKNPGGAPVSLPWHVAVLRIIPRVIIDDVYIYRCGGTIISGHWVVTAAHCFAKRPGKDVNPNRYLISVGQNDLNNLKRTSLRRIRHIIRHPTYGYDFRDDVALVKTRKSLFRNTTAVPICLPSSSTGVNFINRICLLSGWGRLQKADGPRLLRSLLLRTIRRQPCVDILDRAIPNSTHDDQLGSEHFCGKTIDGQSIGFGDSGGPLVCDFDGKFYFVGIASFLMLDSIGNSQGYPAIFTDLTKFLAWINKTLSRYD